MLKEKINLRRLVLFRRWSAMTNMSPAQIRSVREDPNNEHISQTAAEAESAGAGVTAGREASKVIEKMITLAAPYRNSTRNVPKEWTKEMWILCGRAVAFISRFRSNVGALTTSDGEPTPKNLALQFWGRDEVKARSKFPNKEEIKQEVVTLVKKEREQAKEEKEKEKKKKDLSESFFSDLLNI